MGPSRSHMNCCIVGCNSTYSNSPGTKFYGFPTRHWESKRRERWIELVRRQNDDGTVWLPTKNSKICSKHFVGNTKANEEKHPAYNPSIFLSPYRKGKPRCSDDRYERQNERQKRKGAKQKQDMQSLDEAVPASEVATGGADAVELTESGPIDASTMTEGPSECFTGTLTFVSITMDGNASCYVCHRTVPTVDRGTACDIKLRDKSVGPVHKQPYFGGFKALGANESALQSFTSVSFQIFALLLSVLPAATHRVNELSVEDELLLFLIKIKHGLPFSFLASLFCIPSTTASSIFKLVLVNLKSATKHWIYWPSRAAIHRTMPASFRAHYPTCRVILECTELETEMPPGTEERNLWCSQYEGRCTLKYLIGIAPNGMITFISEGFRGRPTDATLAVEATFLSLLEPGDVVLADKGLLGICTDVGEQRATLVMPPFATSPQFTESEVDATYETASVRIHFERVIQRLKKFAILTHRIPYKFTGYIDDILHVAAVITNVKPGSFARNDGDD
ncbi:uncharacterized protein LOC115327734 [Ixodes scapularis]|uniref:uncharacterized protein LOC115327734 n=1 Tax=Ixodes scapularis TaxID=6945 RepID=UPI001C385B81|nr:uncharacterized protein LOC115327734 [Ixodes scapularis]